MSTRELAASLKLPYPVTENDLLIEYYFKDLGGLLAISADEDFRLLHVEAEPYVRTELSQVTLTWIEVYLEDGKLVNIDSEGNSTQPSFAELSDIKVSEKPLFEYY